MGADPPRRQHDGDRACQVRRAHTGGSTEGRQLRHRELGLRGGPGAGRGAADDRRVRSAARGQVSAGGRARAAAGAQAGHVQPRRGHQRLGLPRPHGA